MVGLDPTIHAGTGEAGPAMQKEQPVEKADLDFRPARLFAPSARVAVEAGMVGSSPTMTKRAWTALTVNTAVEFLLAAIRPAPTLEASQRAPSLQGLISIGVPFATRAQISDMSSFVTAIQP